MLKGVICQLLDIYVLAVFGRIIFTWIPIEGTNPVASVRSFLIRITEPVLGPLRRLLPALRFGNFGLDLSPILLLVAISILQSRRILGC